jgi:hypothetical protein
VFFSKTKKLQSRLGSGPVVDVCLGNMRNGEKINPVVQGIPEGDGSLFGYEVNIKI